MWYIRDWLKVSSAIDFQNDYNLFIFPIVCIPLYLNISEIISIFLGLHGWVLFVFNVVFSVMIIILWVSYIKKWRIIYNMMYRSVCIEEMKKWNTVPANVLFTNYWKYVWAREWTLV